MKKVTRVKMRDTIPDKPVAAVTQRFWPLGQRYPGFLQKLTARRIGRVFFGFNRTARHLQRHLREVGLIKDQQPTR